MSPKNLALIAAAVAVMGMGVYLFVQVRSTPAQAQSTGGPVAHHDTTPPPAVERPERNEHNDRPPVTAVQPRPSSPAQAVMPVRPAPTAPVETQVAEEQQRANPKLDSMMELANKAYDTQDFDQATAIAGKVLSKDPTNVRMLRIMVSSNCIGGDASVAQQYYEKLPKGIDREQMKLRCDRYQVILKD